jgi:hypothetical protein
MDDGTLKTPTPKFRLYWSYLVGGGGAIFVGSESGQKQSVKLLQNMVYNTIQRPPPPPPHRHTLSVYAVHLVWEGGGGGQREGRGATVNKYSSFVHGGNSSQAGSKVPAMSECISSL